MKKGARYPPGAPKPRLHTPRRPLPPLVRAASYKPRTGRPRQLYPRTRNVLLPWRTECLRTLRACGHTWTRATQPWSQRFRFHAFDNCPTYLTRFQLSVAEDNHYLHFLFLRLRNIVIPPRCYVSAWHSLFTISYSIENSKYFHTSRSIVREIRLLWISHSRNFERFQSGSEASRLKVANYQAKHLIKCFQRWSGWSWRDVRDRQDTWEDHLLPKRAADDAWSFA